MRIFYAIAFVTLSCVACFGQSSYKGLTPGQSTRSDVERVLGQPAKSVSKTLVEYKSPEAAGKLFVQYRDESPTAIVERIELSCTSEMGDLNPDSKCSKLHLAIQEKYAVKVDMADTRKKMPGGDNSDTKYLYYFGRPRFMVHTEPFQNSGGKLEFRWAFYSTDLFEGVIPKEGGCAHMSNLLGDWDTNRGRMTIVREGITEGSGWRASERVRGTFSSNNGTFSGLLSLGMIEGEWKDATGTGTMRIQGFGGKDPFTGQWKRSTGSGPAAGTWEGRCVETKSGSN